MSGSGKRDADPERSELSLEGLGSEPTHDEPTMDDSPSPKRASEGRSLPSGRPELRWLLASVLTLLLAALAWHWST